MPGAYPLIGNHFDFAEGVHEAMPKLVAKYGGIFSAKFPSGSKYSLPFPGPTVLLQDPKLLEEMYNRHDDFNKKHFKHGAMRKGAAGQGLFTTDDDEPIHDQASRILLPAFSMNGMKEYFGIISTCTDILMGVFDGKAKQGTPVDLHHMLSCYTLEIIGRVGFGMEFNAMHETNDLIKLLDEFCTVTVRLKSYPLKTAQAAAAITTGDMARMRKIQADLKKYLSKVIADKKGSIEAAKQCPVTGEAGKCPMKDMAERMLTVADPVTGEMLPDENVMAQVATFLVAGHDSTSTAITMLLYRLAQHPEVEEQVYQEVMSVVGNGPITWEALGKMTYCTQVVKESLRMYSPATGPLKVSPVDRATTLGPYEIPPGTVLIISTWGLHYNPEVYPEPFKFDPDRWSPENAGKRSPYAWLPFSYGKRACIGMQLSLIEQKMCLAEMVRKFHLRIHESTRLVTTEPIFLNPQGIYVQVTPRSSLAPPTLRPALRMGHSNTEVGFKVEAAAELSGKKLQVLFGSNMGTCEDLADRILRRCEDMGLTCSKAPLDAACASDPVELPKGDDGLVLVITSTYNGQPPENARAFDAWLATPEAAEKFKGVRFAVFGCGNRQWAGTYMAFSQKVQSALEAMGGLVLAPFGTGDMDSGEAEFAFSRWEIAVCIAFMRSHHVPVPESIQDCLYPRMLEYNVFQLMGKRMKDIPLEYLQQLRMETQDRAKAKFLKGSFPVVKVECNRELVAAEGRSTRHIEVPLPEGVTYTAGDHLGVCAPNPPDVVIAYLDHLNIAHDAVVKVELEENVAMSMVPLDRLIGAFSILAWCFELQGVASRAQLRALSKLASKEEERNRLVAMSEWSEGGEGAVKDLHQEFVKDQRRTLLEILKEFPSVEIGLGQLMGMLPANKPRYYSISSSPQKLANSVSVSVSVVSGKSTTGRLHLGMCSNYLKEYPRKLPTSVHPSYDMMLLAFVKDTGSTFRLPKSTDTPVIMLGPGTGIAPMRGFIQDRVASGAKENVLFFGCRDDEDYIYREELESWQKDGFLELHVAFSRRPGTSKTYVQNLVEVQGAHMVDLVKRGAHIYVCGDASKMAPDVQRTFAKLVADAGLGEDYVDKMLEDGRYCQDVWAAQSM